MTKPLLTIGMATFDDYEGVWATIQALRIYHAQHMPQVEILLVDNNPDSKHGESNRALMANVKGDVAKATYVPMGGIQGTSAPRDRVFREAAGKYVLCVDCHIMLPPDSLEWLLDYYKDNPDTRDLLSGPMVYDDLRNRSSHFDDQWSDEMWGQWAYDRRADPFIPTYTRNPFPIPAMGLGMFSCRKDAWLGFHPDFRGFGGEEWYIHEKFRKAGHRCLCIPGATWVHRFGRPSGVRYPITRWNKVRNYVIGHKDLGMSLNPIYDHFVSMDTKGEPLAQHLVRVHGRNPKDLEGKTTAELEQIHRERKIPEEWWKAILGGAVDQPAAPQGTGGCGSCGGGDPGPARPLRPLPPARSTLEQIFAFVKGVPRDLDQHADFVYRLASECDTITAFVKRREWCAILAAARPKILTVYQREADPLLGIVDEAVKDDRIHNVATGKLQNYVVHLGAASDSLKADPTGVVDLLVIDSIHHADVLWQELDRHGRGAQRILLRGTGAFAEKAEGGNGPGLMVAVRRWVKEHPEWTVVVRRNDQYGMAVLSRRKQDKKEPPSLWQQGVNAAKASWRSGANVLANPGPLKDTPAQDRRLSLCLVCPSHNNGRCAECGCPVDAKTTWPAEFCPNGHWHAEEK